MLENLSCYSTATNIRLKPPKKSLQGRKEIRESKLSPNWRTKEKNSQLPCPMYKLWPNLPRQNLYDGYPTQLGVGDQSGSSPRVTPGAGRAFLAVSPASYLPVVAEHRPVALGDVREDFFGLLLFPVQQQPPRAFWYEPTLRRFKKIFIWDIRPRETFSKWASDNTIQEFKPIDYKFQLAWGINAMPNYKSINFMTIS